MAINRELSQFGRLVEIIDGEHIGIGTTSNVSIDFGTITATTINATTINAPISGIASNATYATTAGIATYASTAGIATNAQGLSGTPNIIVGIATATSFIKSGGTSSQFLKADGTVDSSTYLTTTGSAANLINITGASANTYGNATTVPQLSVDTNGRITSISNVTISLPISSQWTTGASGITTTSNVGIKSTVPTSALDVTGDVKISGVATATSFIKSGGTSLQFLKADGSVDSTTYASQSYVGLSTSGLASQSYVDSKVGLSTTGLLASTGSGVNLTGIVTSIVAGTNVTVSGSTGQVTINSTASGSQWTTGASGISTTSSVLIGSTTPTGTASQLLQVTGSAYVSGNLGVGNTNPGTKLDVSGIGRFTANGATLNLVGTDHSYIEWYPDGVAAGRKAYTGYPNGSANYFEIANEIADGSGHIYLNPGTSAAVLIETTTATGTASQPLQVSGGAYVSGNLGVGVTNPVSKLDVSGGSITLSSVPFFRNIPTISADYTVTTSYNEMSIGPITINSGVTVTVNSGATWTVV